MDETLCYQLFFLKSCKKKANTSFLEQNYSNQHDSTLPLFLTQIFCLLGGGDTGFWAFPLC